MTTDATHARDINCAHTTWASYPAGHRPTFGAFAVNFLRERGLEVTPIEGRAPVIEATEMLGEVTDLLAALAKRGLTWVPGENGECGALVEGPPEPPDLHVVFDRFGTAWQRGDDDDSANPDLRWFGPHGAVRSWTQLQRRSGPLTPDGGIAPTTPAP